VFIIILGWREIVILLSSFVVAIIGSLAYVARYVGVELRKPNTAGSVFNIALLLSRVAITLQVPLILKYIEVDINAGRLSNSPSYVLVYAAMGLGILGTAGALLLFSFVASILRSAVSIYVETHSLLAVLRRSIGVILDRRLGNYASYRITKGTLLGETDSRGMPKALLFTLMLTTAVNSAAMYSSMTAGLLVPEFRTTALSLSVLFNAFATFALMFFVDPRIGLYTDHALTGEVNLEFYKRLTFYTMLAVLLGSVLAIPLVIPFARIIAAVAPLL
jgi:hypothetical protein